MKELPYVIECWSFAKFFEPIAAFNDKRIAEFYAIDCQKANPQFTYRMQMNFTYICELIYKNGDSRIVGPFKHTMGSTTGNAAAYGEEFKNMANSEVVDYKVRILESPQTR